MELQIPRNLVYVLLLVNRLFCFICKAGKALGTPLTINSSHVELVWWNVVCILYHCYTLKWHAAWVLPGPWFNIKMTSYQYRRSHCGDKTILRLSYLHNGIPYTGKTPSLYWTGALVGDKDTISTLAADDLVMHRGIISIDIDNLCLELSEHTWWGSKLYYKQRWVRIKFYQFQNILIIDIKQLLMI